MATIIEKLQLSKYSQKLILNLPKDISDFTNFEFDTEILQKKYDLIFIFIFSLQEFSDYVSMIINKELLNNEGYVFFAYPKKGNKQYKEYIGRDDFFPIVNMDEDGYVNKSSIKFNRMVALNDTFTTIGLKNVMKKIAKISKPSQCVDDYIDNIVDLQNHFANNPEVLQLYNNLSFGYQKDWARYIYSAQTTTTIEKRLLEMEEILKQGYKSKDLYRRKNFN